MKLVFTILFCLLFLAARSQRLPLPFSPRHSPAIARILQKQLSKGLPKGTQLIRERLTGYSLYLDSVISDSINYAYSHGRGSETMGLNFDWYYNDFYIVNASDFNNGPEVTLLYDSAHHYIFSRDSAGVLNSIKETAYRGYDSLNRMVWHSLISPIGCNQQSNLFYNTAGNPDHYNYHYDAACSGNPQFDSLPVRQFTYINNLRMADSMYGRNNPYSVTKYTYDAAGNMTSEYFREWLEMPGMLVNDKRNYYSYDSLNRVIAVHGYWDGSGTGGWIDGGIDSFYYTGSNRMYTAHGPNQALLITQCTLDAQGRWDTFRNYSVSMNLLVPNTWFKYEYTPLGHVQKVTLINPDSLWKLQVLTMYYETYIDTTGDTATLARPSANAYPNPVTTTLNLNFTNPHAKEVTIDIYNIAGSLSQHLLIPAVTSASIPIGELPDGMYIVRVLTGGKIAANLRFIKKE